METDGASYFDPRWASLSFRTQRFNMLWKRPIAAVCFVIFVLVGSNVSPVRAQDEEVLEGEGAEQEYRNAINFGFIYLHSILREEEGELPGESARGGDNLYGFALSYERVLIPGHLAIVFVKPFLFTRGRYDSPWELLLKGIFRKKAWEPFVAAGIVNNLRIFAREREESEGRRVEYAFGIVAATGVAYLFNPHWGLELELAYNYVVNLSSVSQHDLNTTLNGVYYFQRGQRTERRAR